MEGEGKSEYPMSNKEYPSLKEFTSSVGYSLLDIHNSPFFLPPEHHLSLHHRQIHLHILNLDRVD